MDNPFSDSPEKTKAPAPKVAPSEPIQGAENPFESSSAETVPKKTPIPDISAPVVTKAPKAGKVEGMPDGEMESNSVEASGSGKTTPDKMSDEDEDGLLIENDGNVFWLFQKVVWSVLKMALVVGIIGFLTWIIWRPTDVPFNGASSSTDEEGITRAGKIVEKQEERKREENKKYDSAKAAPDKKVKKAEESKSMSSRRRGSKSSEMKEKEIPIVEASKISTVSALSENYAYKAGLWADWMEDTRQAQNAQILSRSLYWAKRAEGFFELTTSDFMFSEDSVERAQSIDTTIRALRGVLEESMGLMMTLNSELNKASAQSRASEAGMLEQGRLLSSSIDMLDGERAEFLLAEKSRLYQDFVAQNSKITAYHFVLNRVQSMIPPLQNIYDNLLSNRQVLIDNVQIVGFPGDQFHRILTPAEWQGMK